MTYSSRGDLHSYDIENILNMFGLEKAKESADMALSVEEGCLKLHGEGVAFSTPLFYPSGSPVEKDELKRAVYRYLCGIFGEPSGWGILVGVRPVKLASQMLAGGMTPEDVSHLLVRDYLLSPENANLLVEIAEYENIVAPPCVDKKSAEGEEEGIKRRRNASLYLSVPFCPTRCKYCSFPMQPLLTKRRLLPLYFEKLKVELEETLKMLAEEGVEIDCIYFGGGTPSTLEPEMIEALGGILQRYIDFKTLKEFTFEAGRSDTIDEELIRVLIKIGVDRVSINPQSFTEAALRHSLRERPAGEFEKAFALAKSAGLKINSDLILGLEGEDERQYLDGLRYLIGLRPENITVHALSLKRGSPLFGEKVLHSTNSVDKDSKGSVREKFAPVKKAEEKPAEVDLLREGCSCENEENCLQDAVAIRRRYLSSQRKRYLSMSRGGAEILQEAGYRPYYLYRQKRILANLENIGYSLQGEGCLYNSRIMSERYDIFAVGTGGVTKICYPAENRHEQIAGTRSVEDYLDHFSKVLERIEVVRAHIAGERGEIRRKSGGGAANDISET